MRKIRVIGDAVVSAATAGEWTRRIRRKYDDIHPVSGDTNVQQRLIRDHGATENQSAA